MAQNLVSLNLAEADFAEIDTIIGQLEAKLSGLINLSVEQRRAVSKMGDKSEAFCRQTLTVLAQNPQMVPASLGLEEAQKDLASLDAIRKPIARLQQLVGRAQDTEMALGSDVMSAALEGYALLKVMGKGSGIEGLKQGLGARFSKSPRGAGKTESETG